MVFVVVGGIITFTIKNTRCYVLFGFCIAPLVGLIGIHTISLDHRWSLVGCAFLQFIIGGPVIMCWILLNANVSGSSKRTIANGIWFLLVILSVPIFFTPIKHQSTTVELLV